MNTLKQHNWKERFYKAGLFETITQDTGTGGYDVEVLVEEKVLAFIENEIKLVQEEALKERMNRIEKIKPDLKKYEIQERNVPDISEGQRAFTAGYNYAKQEDAITWNFRIEKAIENFRKQIVNELLTPTPGEGRGKV